MHAVAYGERTLTELDFARIQKFPGGQLPPALSQMLDGAELTSPRDVPADVVTMYSRIEIVNAQTHGRQVITLCYPRDAQPHAGFISVLSPVGSALLGLRVGDTARWLTPNGDPCSADILAIQYQPERSGDFSL